MYIKLSGLETEDFRKLALEWANEITKRKTPPIESFKKFEPLVDVGILVRDKEMYGDEYAVVDTTNPITKALPKELLAIANEIQDIVS
jgi:hypothetical protein